MKRTYLIGLVLLASLAATAQNSYTATPIVNNTQDPLLVNPWGLSRPISSTVNDNEWWASDNATGYTTLYFANKTGAQSLAGLIISVPSATGSGTGTPTGTVYNGTGGPGPGAFNFSFATLDGIISNWNAGAKPAQVGTGCYECHVTTTTVMVNNSSKKASYFGLATAVNGKTPIYYASNFNGGVESYNATTFLPIKLSGKFTDTQIPSSYKPYGIQNIGKFVYVTYFNGTSGGYVDAYDTNGNLKLRFANGNFDEPWGVAQAPSNFGTFSNSLLVGNTTSGMIGAYNAVTGAFQGFLEDSTGTAIVIPGLWGISFGNGNVKSGPTNTLYYNAGGTTYTTGVFGAITFN